MTTLSVNGDVLDVRFTLAEKVGGLLPDIRVPLTAVRCVEVVADGLEAAAGIRAPGLAIPGHRKIGTWRRRGAKAAVSVRRHRPALRIDLDGHRFDVLLLDVPQPHRLAEALQAATR